MISKAEAVLLTNDAKYLRSHPDEAHLRETLENISAHIQAAAESGRDMCVFNMGSSSHEVEIEKTLKANGFDVTYNETSYIIKWA